MELKPLTHFFNKRIYAVPSYQRGYSWRDKEIIDLLTDIKHAIKLDSVHYTGTITIHGQKQTEKIGLNNYEIYHIVDGQQRLTTLILILAHIVRELKMVKAYRTDAIEKAETYISNKGSYLFRYSIDKVSENYFRSLILEVENLSSLEENLYTRNLLNAKDVIANYFDVDDKETIIVEYLNAIEEKLLFNEYIVANTTEIGVVFETMNNRGIDLSNLEIVKNRLLYLTSKISVGEEGESEVLNLSEKINTKWAVILKNLTLPSRVLDEDTFLSNHWVIYRGWSKANQAKTEILDIQFSISKMVEDPKAMIHSINRYIDSLATTSLHWRFINYPLEDRAFVEVKALSTRQNLKELFNKLNRLSNSTVRPMLLAFMPLMKSNPEFLLELVRLAEEFCFRLFSMNRRRSDTGKNDIYRKCHEFHSEAETEYTQQEALHYLAWWIDYYGDHSRFVLEVEELFRSGKKHGFYSWAGLNYFLFEYEESLRGVEDYKLDYVFANNRYKSIEHILPQTYEDTQWKELVKDLSTEEIKECLHSLGNLVLISAPKNSSLKNSNFSIKRQSYKSGSFSEIEIAQSNKVWNLKKIKEREKDLLKFLEKRWSMDKMNTDIYPHPNNIEIEMEHEEDWEDEQELED